jgi:hypothetical protein
MFISTVVLAGVYSTFVVGNRAWAHYNESISVKREARRALWGMVNELRAGENVRVVQGPNGSSIHFHKPDAGTVSFVWSKIGDDAGRIIRLHRLDTRIFAGYTTSLSFQPSDNAVVIDITAGKPPVDGKAIEVHLREKVTLRSQTVFFR